VRIAQIAPLTESVPPELYGGTERIVSYLTEELVRVGHDVTLFASGDSKTSARMVSCTEGALRLDPSIQDPLPYFIMMLEEVRRRADEFDVLHFHIDLIHAPLIHEFADRTVTTLHGRLDLPDLKPFYDTFQDLPLVSISHDQRRPIATANWIGNVYHGLPSGSDLTGIIWPSLGGSHRTKDLIEPSILPDCPVCRSRSQPKSTRSMRHIGMMSYIP
jgi:glycosyltransferase involved in cell wall biosynthesis